MLADNVSVTQHRRFHIEIYDPLVGKIFLQAVIHHFGIILRADARQRGLLRFGNTEPVKGLLNLLRYLIPVGRHRLFVRNNVVNNLLNIQVGNISAPVRHRPFKKILQRLQSEVEHPLGFELASGNLPHHIFIQTDTGGILIIDFILYIVNAPLNIGDKSALPHLEQG